jgi:hypothetical protein
MRVKTAISMLLVAGLGLALSACYYAPAPGYGYYDSGYSSSGYYAPAPAYYGSGYYYGPSVGVYYSGRWGGRSWR